MAKGLQSYEGPYLLKIKWTDFEDKSFPSMAILMYDQPQEIRHNSGQKHFFVLTSTLASRA